MEQGDPALTKRKLEEAGTEGEGEEADNKKTRVEAGAKAMADNKKEEGGCCKARGKGGKQGSVLWDMFGSAPVLLGEVSLMTFLIPLAPIEAGLGAGLQCQLLVKKIKEGKEAGAAASSRTPEEEMKLDAILTMLEEAMEGASSAAPVAENDNSPPLPAIFVEELAYNADNTQKVKLWWNEGIAKAGEEEDGAESPITKEPLTPPPKGRTSKKMIAEGYGKMIVAFKNKEVAEILHRGVVGNQALDLLSHYSR